MQLYQKALFLLEKRPLFVTKITKVDGEVKCLETINDRKRLHAYIQSRQILAHFSSFRPDFFLLRYSPGELLTNPFSPSDYLQFIVDGELLLYDMPDENSTVMIQTTYLELHLLGEVELLDTQFTPFFVEAVSEVYTVALHVSRYREQLLNDPAFLRCVCRSLCGKLNGAVTAATPMPLKKRMEVYVETADPEQPITEIAHLAKTFNVSTRQLLRVLKELCGEGVLEHRQKGIYRICSRPGSP